MHLATRNGFVAVVEQLLAAGADKDVKNTVRDADGEGAEGQTTAFRGILFSGCCCLGSEGHQAIVAFRRNVSGQKKGITHWFGNGKLNQNQK